MIASSAPALFSVSTIWSAEIRRRSLSTSSIPSESPAKNAGQSDSAWERSSAAASTSESDSAASSPARANASSAAARSRRTSAVESTPVNSLPPHTGSGSSFAAGIAAGSTTGGPIVGSRASAASRSARCRSSAAVSANRNGTALMFRPTKFRNLVSHLLNGPSSCRRAWASSSRYRSATPAARSRVPVTAPAISSAVFRTHCVNPSVWTKSATSFARALRASKSGRNPSASASWTLSEIVLVRPVQVPAISTIEPPNRRNSDSRAANVSFALAPASWSFSILVRPSADRIPISWSRIAASPNGRPPWIML